MKRTLYVISIGFVVVLCGAGCISIPRSQSTLEPKWKVIVEETFDDASRIRAHNISIDPALKYPIIDGCGSIAGVSSDDKWEGNYWVLRIPSDTNDMLEISADFKIADADGYVLVALWGTSNFKKDGPGAMCLFYQGKKDKGTYHIQQAHMLISSQIIDGKRHRSGFGNESTAFHSMRMILDRRASLITYFIDGSKLGTGKFDGSIVPVKMLRIGVQTPDKNKTLDIRCDNLRVRGASKPK